MPSPAKNAATSGGSGAAALTTFTAWSRPSRPLIGVSTAASAAANLAASSSEVVLPYWQLCTYSRPTSMAAATAARLASSCSMVSSAWMPAWIFSQTLGTPKNAVGFTCADRPDQVRRVMAEVRVAGAVESQVEGEHPLGDVSQRQVGDPPDALRGAAGHLGGLALVQDAAVGDDHALGVAGRARGVQQRHRIGRLDGVDPAADLGRGIGRGGLLAERLERGPAQVRPAGGGVPHDDACPGQAGRPRSGSQRASSEAPSRTAIRTSQSAATYLIWSDARVA